jgi:putative ABC transport system permease protein
MSNMTALACHLRTSVRPLLRAPMFSLAVIASLAISIGAVTAVFSVVDAVLLRALPYRDPDGLVWISSVRPTRADAPFSLPEFIDYRAQSRSADIAAYSPWSAAMSTSGAARRLQGMRISANAFDVLGVSASAGRLLRPHDDLADAPRVVVLAHGFWLTQFGGADSIVGQTLRLNNQPYQVIGVLPRYFPMPLRNVDIVVPLVPDLDPRRNIRTSTNFLRLFARVGSSATLATAQRELTAIADDLRQQFPSEYASKSGVRVSPMHEYLVGGTRQTLGVVLGAAALLLAIAIANVLNLLLMRDLARQGEMAIRRALGGSPHHLAVSVTGEAAVLAVTGALAGAVLAKWAVALIVRSSIGIPRLDEAHLDARALLLGVGISIVATVLFSAIPLLAAGRSEARSLLSALSAAGRGQHGLRAQSRLRSVLVVLQLALAVQLSVVTATMVRSLTGLQHLELGYRPDSVFVAQVSLPPQKYRSTADVARFADEFQSALRAGEGVVAVGVISIAPLSGSLATVPFGVVGEPPVQGRDLPDVNFRAISPGYLRAVGASVSGGRDFEPADNESGRRVAIVSRALVDRFFGGREALGRQVMVDDNNDGPRPLVVVGVVENMRHVAIDGPATHDVFIPMAQVHRDGVGLVTGSQFWTVRLAWTGTSYPATFARTLAAIDRDVAVSRVRPLKAYVDDYLAPRKFSVSSLLGFAIVALVLATVGVFGTVAYSVEQRRREIGLRLALGSTPAGVARFILMPVMRLAVAGACLGVIGTVLTRHAVAGLLFGVTPTEPAIVLGVSLVLIATSALAAAIPARRAARIAPSIALSGD